MQLGDRVVIIFPGGREEEGTIGGLDAATVLIRRGSISEGAALVVPRPRLRPAGPGCWRLDL